VTRRIALLGGTFDPLHLGHLAIAEAARRAAEADVVFVPTARNPLKRDEPSVSAEDRYEMVRRALYAAPGMRACRIELDRDGPSYTVDTLAAFSADGVELSLVLGADALADLPRWHEPARVLELAALLVARRPGAPEPDLADVRALSREARVQVLDVPLVDLSSRELRAHARSGGSLRYLVPEPAWRYMVDKRLYGQVERR
jgi:nicotinate-nucleotide adenylyltransferase